MVPPKTPDPTATSALTRLKRALEATDYRSGRIEDMIPTESANAYRQGWFNPVLNLTDASTPLDTLVRLFTFGFEVQADALEDVPEAAFDDWVATGFVTVRRRTVHPLVAIRPAMVRGVNAYLACDAPEPGRGEPSFSEFVRGITRPSSLLAKLTTRRRFHRALDVGTGEGIQAILASTHCDEVVATDINPRALAFARFNLAWNGIDNVTLRRGDRYEPVGGEEYDLLISNPPYVISPSRVTRFRDSGLDADTISATTVHDAAEHLTLGGWAYVLAQWALHDGERWEDRVESWVADTACDALSIQLMSVDPVAHAAAELGELRGTEPQKADQQFEEWLRYYDDVGITRIGTGFVVLRRRSGPTWYRAEEVAEEPADGSAEAIVALFDAQDWLFQHSDAGSVLDIRWRGAEGARLEMISEVTSRHWKPSGYVLRFASGLRTSMEIPRDLGEILSGCDGGRPLRSVFDDHWRARGREASSPWHEQELEKGFRRIIAGGFVVPAN